MIRACCPAPYPWLKRWQRSCSLTTRCGTRRSANDADGFALQPQPPVHDPATAENPEGRSQRDERSVVKAAGPLLFLQGNHTQTIGRTDNGAEHESEDHGLPAEKCANGGHEFDIAQSHRLTRHDQFVCHYFEMLYVVGLERVVAHEE